MNFARLIRIVFGTLAGLMLIAAFADVMLVGRLTIITPWSFGALLSVALAFLISILLSAREHQALLIRQADGLRASNRRFENSLGQTAAANQTQRAVWLANSQSCRKDARTNSPAVIRNSRARIRVAHSTLGHSGREHTAPLDRSTRIAAFEVA